MSTRTRKSVSVTFAGDDEVVHHIIDIQDKSRRRKHSNKNEPKLPRKQKASQSQTEDICEEDENSVRTPSEFLAGEGIVGGSDVFQFKSIKKSGQMALKASESRTPKSAGKTKTPSTPSRKQSSNKENVTPAKTRKKLEATTPYRLKKRNEEFQNDSSSDDSLDESDSDNESVSSRDTPCSPQTPRHISRSSVTDKNTPSTPQSRSRTKAKQIEDMPSMVEGYFHIHADGVGPTSDRTLSKLDMPRMDQESLANVLKSTQFGHKVECKQLMNEHRSLFKKWMFQMCNDFNILLYGLGSKRCLIEEFRKTVLKDFSHVVVNGYFPSLTVKHILNSITDDILGHGHSIKNPIDQCEFIKSCIEREQQDFYLVVHNIDGIMLRPEKTQNILSLLAQIHGFHIIASIDHINAPLIFDHTKCSRYNWLWYDSTNFIPYSDETSYENSLLVQQSGALALSSLTHVMKSLTPNAKGIFMLLAKYQMENKDNSTYIGMAFHDMYQRCRESFLVNSDLTLRAQLTEFRDHKLIRSKKNYDGVEHLMIPIDAATLEEFIEQCDDS